MDTISAGHDSCLVVSIEAILPKTGESSNLKDEFSEKRQLPQE